MRYKVNKFLGLNTDQQASLAISESRGEENLFLGLLSLTSDDAFTKGRQLLSDAADQYFEFDGEISEKLENVFNKLKEDLKESEGSILLASISGKSLYLLGEGKVLAHLRRSGNLKPLFIEGSGQLISGFLSGEDKILIATCDLTAILNSQPETWEEEITESLTNNPEGGAALLIEVQSGEDVEIPSVAGEHDVLSIFKDKKMPLFKIPNWKFILAIVLILIIGVVLAIFVKNKINEKQQFEKQKIQEEQTKKGEQLKTEVSNFTLFLDLGLIKEGFSAKNLSLSGEKILLLDTSSKTLVSIDLTKKSHQILAGLPQLGDAKLASLNGSSAFVYSKDKGVLRIDLETKSSSVSAKQNKDLGEILDLYGFGGNIYLLDKIGQIWKYVAITSGFSDKRKYLNDGVKADFNSVLRMQIESSVYILKSGGEIVRFTRGEPDNFSIGGLDKGLPAGRQGIKDPKSIFISSDTDNLYVLDSGNSRLVVLGKTGEYKEQYNGEKFGSATDLAVDEKNKKAYLLDGSKIYVT
ncbi:MAG: Uncharacterized protein G01um101493_326, partial [Microgenomates group bacterium Gr01-1014_93]